MRAYLFDCRVTEDELWVEGDRAKCLAFLRIAKNFPKYKGMIRIMELTTFEKMFNDEEIKDSDMVIFG